MENEKVQDEDELESQDFEDEDEEIEKMLEELEEEELEEEKIEKIEIETPQSESTTDLEIDLKTKEDEISVDMEAAIPEKKEIPTMQNSTEETSIMAQISKTGDLEQIIEPKDKESLETEGSLMSDQEIDKLEAVQDKFIKEQFRDLPAYIEAILFEVGKPLKEPELVDLLYDKFKADKNRIRWGLRKVMRALEAQQSSIQLINPTKDFWSFQLHRDLPDEFFNKIEKFIPEEEFISKRERVFLTEIAYRQPVTTTEILKILGADGYEYIRSLEDKDLIYLTKEVQSNIIRTTEKFAQLFGFDPELRSLKMQLVWRLKKLARSEAARDKATLAQLKEDREKYGS